MRATMFRALDREIVANQQFETASIAICHVSMQLLALAGRESTGTQFVEQMLGVKLDDGS